MADNRYGGHGRSESIFNDDERDYRGRGYDEPTRSSGRERGFFERAGDEIRSMFHDEGSGERDTRRGRVREDYAGSYGRHGGGSGGYGARGHVQSWGEANQGDGRQRDSHPDHQYRSWRDQQISQFDRDYEDYRRERQQQFESDFDTWRRNRGSGAADASKGESGVGGIASGKTGIGGQAQGSGATTGGSGTDPMASGGASEAGGANLSATEASTGSNARTGKGRKTAR